jgi:hypothetical protein
VVYEYNLGNEQDYLNHLNQNLFLRMKTMLALSHNGITLPDITELILIMAGMRLLGIMYNVSVI